MKSFEELKSKPYIIAELSSNHAKRLEIVIKSIESAAKAGADAIKTQLYTPDSLTLPNKNYSPIIDDPKSPWNKRSLYDLYDEASLPYDWYPEMIKCAEENSIDLFASIFDIKSLDFALSLKMPILKISSFELIHKPLLEYAQKTNLPTIISTGMALVNEIDQCVEIFKENMKNICLLKCTSDYPASLEDTHIGQMIALKEKYKVSVGLSDHSLSNLPAILATSHGATIIEKHFIVDKNLKTPDAFFSLDENEFKNLVADIRSVKKMLSLETLDCIRQESESHSIWERPSMYFAKDLTKGHILNKDDLLIRRPSLGISPLEINKIIGKKLKHSVKKYQPTNQSQLNQI